MSEEANRNNEQGLYELYDQHQLLGVGGQAQVYEVSHKEGKETFAAKMFLPEANLQDARREAKIMEKLRGCPGTVQLERLVKDPDQRDDLAVIVMKLYGQTLLEYYMLENNNDCLKEEVVAAIVKKLACTLKLMHARGVVHRDLKLENVFFERDSASPSDMVIGDFGFATDDKEDMCDICGTKNYVSPEVLDGRKYTAAVDVWGLGIMAYELLGGCPGEDVYRGKLSWSASISRNAKNLVSRMLARNPKKRCTLDNVLMHPWIVKHTATATVTADTKPRRCWNELLPGRSWLNRFRGVDRQQGTCSIGKPDLIQV